MGKMRKGWLIAALALVVVILGRPVSISYLRGSNTAPENSPADETENKILIHVYVKLDPPSENLINEFRNKLTPAEADILKEIKYKLRNGTPPEVGAYGSYSSHSWSYEKLDAIPLERVDELTFYGSKSVGKTNPGFVYEHDNFCMYDNALCVGYPGIKYCGGWIDGITFVRIDQSGEEATVTVYYWEGSGPIPPGDTSSEASNWLMIVLIPFIVLIITIAIIVRFVKRARLAI